MKCINCTAVSVGFLCEKCLADLNYKGEEQEYCVSCEEAGMTSPDYCSKCSPHFWACQCRDSIMCTLKEANIQIGEDGVMTQLAVCDCGECAECFEEERKYYLEMKQTGSALTKVSHWERRENNLLEIVEKDGTVIVFPN